MARIGFALVFYGLVVAAGGAATTCRRPSVVEWVLGPLDRCSPQDAPAAGGRFQGVLKGDEITLQRAVNILYRNKEQYIAVLFYASWCPFSKICLTNFNNMPSLFPSIPHFAFEESVIRPSILSRYGVHGFPTLFLLNSSMRVRYHGSRSLNSLAAFYYDVTGFTPASVDLVTVLNTISFPNFVDDVGDTKKENCPFSWARSPENLLKQDTYLALATSFVLLRLLFFLLPKLRNCAKRAWRWPMNVASLMSLMSKRSNLHEGAMSAKAWASKSLASVSIGEPSSLRSQTLN